MLGSEVNLQPQEDVVKKALALVNKGFKKRGAKLEGPLMGSDEEGVPQTAELPDANILSRRRFLKWAVFGAGAAVVGGAGYTTLIEPWWVEINHYDISIEFLPAALEGLKIVHLSDLHRGAVVSANFIRECAQRAAALEPDLVCITGDFVTREAFYAETCCSALEPLHPPLGVYATLGNHDYWAGGAAVAAAIRKAGIRILVNEVATLEARGERLLLAGLDDLWTGNPRPDRVAEALTPGIPSVLMMHNPDLIEQFGTLRVGFVMAGHMHGGQVRLPFFGALVTPSRMWRKYVAGFYRVKSNLMYISKGVGLIAPPVRFLTRPEIVCYTLRR